MKEILKYLRTINSFSQEQVAQKIGLSRQSYNKYEAGSVVPSVAVVAKLAELYNVETSFIEANKIPQLKSASKSSDYSYSIEKDFSSKIVSEAEPAYKAESGKTGVILPVSHRKPAKTYDAYFCENSIRLVGYDVPYREGQRLRVTVEEESEEEEEQRKKEAWERLQSYIGKLKWPKEWEGLTEKEIMHQHWEEKYGK